MGLATLAAVGMWGIDKIAGGINAASNAADIQAAKDATWDIYNQKKSLLDDKNKLATDQIGFQFRTGKERLDIGTAGMLQRQKDQLSKSLSKTGFSVSSEVQTAAELDMNKLWAQYQSNQKGLVQQRKMSLEGQRISQASSEIALEEERESGLAALEGQPKTVWEGMWA